MSYRFLIATEYIPRLKWIIILAIVTYLGKISTYENILYPLVVSIEKLLYGGGINNLVIDTSSAYSIGKTLEYLPFLIYVCLTVMGFLLYLKSIKKTSKDIAVSNLIISTALLSIPILKIGMFVLNPRRIFYFFGIIFGFLTSISIWHIYKKLRCILFVNALIFILISLLVFFSMTSNLGNQLDPIFYSGQYPVLYFHTSSERDIIYFLSYHLPRNEDISVISDYKTISRFIAPIWLYKIRTPIEDLSQLTNFKGYAIFSRYSLDYSFLFKKKAGYGIGNTTLENIKHKINENLISQNKIFDGMIIVYFSEGVLNENYSSWFGNST